MKTLEQAFLERQTVLHSVEAGAIAILDPFCKRNGFLLAGRAKSMESLRDKIETGRYSSLDEIDDAIAFSIVIDTLDQEEFVIRFLVNLFQVTSTKYSTNLQDERVFDFDNTRVYCRIIDRIDLKNDIDRITVEVQIRTIMQHAWSKITHSHVYEANVFDAQAGRLAAELMAQIESIDRSFSRFRETSRLVKTVVRREMVASSKATEMIDALVANGTIPAELRPVNGRRLGENIYQAIRRDKRKNYADHIESIKEFMESQKDRFPRSVSLFELAVLILNHHGLLEIGKAGRPRRYYVSDELISLFPEAALIPNRIVIA